MEEKVEGRLAISVPHQDVLIFADIKNETGYDILAQVTMTFYTTGLVPITSLSFYYDNGELEPIFILASNRPKERNSRMNIFYNEVGIGDTLLISLKPIDKDNYTFERKGDAARIYSTKTDETFGYNVFRRVNM